MPVYTWKGLNAAGKNVAGTKDADGPKALRQVLRKEGVFITEHREMLAGAGKAPARTAATAGGQPTSLLKRQVDFKALFEHIRPQEVAIFTRQLATLLKAGIPLAEGLGALSEQSDNKKLEVVLAEIRQKVNEGGSLADALSQHPSAFPELYINMVRSGEAAGNLDSVLARLADFLDAQHALRAKVSGAVTYPIIMACLGGAVMIFLMAVVVPKITAVFEDLGKTLPWNTRLIVFASEIVGSYWWLLILFSFGGWWAFRRWTRTKKGRAKMDSLQLRTWLVGPLVRYVGVARFARTLATMLASGVPVLNALEIVKKVLNNDVLEKVVEEARDAIREGESIAAPLKRSGQFPPMMVHMVAVGERSGQLETMLENVASAYEREVESKVARLTTMLSPIMIIGMALAVGFIVVSVMQPIMEMQDFVQ